MKRLVLSILVVLALVTPAAAHVGSPDVFYEGDAGPYPVYVTVRMPQVIPGVATIEVRTHASDVRAMSVVPLRLTGPGSELPPAPDPASRATDDPQFFTANLWLMEYGALQVRISVDGARGPGVLSVPISSNALRTLGMDRWLAIVLLGLMALLALAIIAIAGAAVREAALDPGVVPDPARRRRTFIATSVASVIVVGLLVLGHAWWGAEAREYERSVTKPWKVVPTVDGCRLTIRNLKFNLLPDHGHDVHLMMVRTPGFDHFAHLHPTADGNNYVQDLPSLPAGHYALFADVVTTYGYPITGTAELDLPDLTCAPLAGDDSAWAQGTPQTIVFDPPAALRANAALALHFRVLDDHGAPATDVEPYMGMAGHAAVIRRDLSVFAHLHPSGTVAMPALMLAKTPHAMYAEGRRLPPEVSFPYGFPQSGAYRVFVQLKRAGAIVTGMFDIDVKP